MAAPQGGNPNTTQYERAICDSCRGEITLTKDRKLRLHRARNHELYGVPGARVPYCTGSRSTLHSAIRNDQ